MKRIIIAAVFAGTLTAPAAFAENEGLVENEQIRLAITDVVTAQGYDVRKIVREDDMFEAYAVKDGAMFEVVLNSAYEIVAVEAK
jgi:hypothetical protein